MFSALACYGAPMDENPSDGLITDTEAHEILSPRYAGLWQCFGSAWTAWRKISESEAGNDLGPSARARIVWEKANALGAQVFGTESGVVRRSRRGLIFFDFSRVLVRFKKFGPAFATRGILTEQRRLLEDQAHLQAEQMELFPKAPMLVVGYVLNKLETEIDRLFVVLQQRGQTLWFIEIPRPGAMAILDYGGVEPVAPTVESLRKAKEEDTERSQ